MNPQTRAVVLDRIALLRRELDSLEQLVGSASRARPEVPVRATMTAKPALAHAGRAAPPLRPASLEEAGEIGPIEAAEILGVTRQTIDRRLKQGKVDVPGSPVDVSGGAVRSWWRWRTPEQVHTWWSHAK